MIIFHRALETFPFNHEDACNIGDRFSKLFHAMYDIPDIKNYDAIHISGIRISYPANTVKQVNNHFKERHFQKFILKYSWCTMIRQK